VIRDVPVDRLVTIVQGTGRATSPTPLKSR
jgi:hypothetical protein